MRLIGVDTPELRPAPECHAEAAAAFVRRALAGGSRVRYRLGREPRDRYGRALAYVWLPDGRMLNALLVERGHARSLAIAPNDELAARFGRAARRARRAGLGVWRCAPTPGAVRCSDFATQAEARRHLDRHPADAERIDGDRDGRPCETLR